MELLLCTGLDKKLEDVFLCPIFTQRPMKDQKIQQSLERCFGQKQVLAESIDSMFHGIKIQQRFRAARWETLMMIDA